MLETTGVGSFESVVATVMVYDNCLWNNQNSEILDYRNLYLPPCLNIHLLGISIPIPMYLIRHKMNQYLFTWDDCLKNDNLSPFILFLLSGLVAASDILAPVSVLY